jgi:hypothetical protein
VENIFPLLEISFPLKGSTSGNFVYRTEGPAVSFEGEFSSPELYLLSTRIEQISGQLLWKDNTIKLSPDYFQPEPGDDFR